MNVLQCLFKRNYRSNIVQSVITEVNKTRGIFIFCLIFELPFFFRVELLLTVLIAVIGY